ncbi:MAG: hypothetical protein V3V30_04765 [Parvularculaceae bacterium]
MDIMSLVMSLLPGIIGGNIGGILTGRRGFGMIGNSIAGIIGGLAGGQGLEAMGGFDIGAITGMLQKLGDMIGMDALANMGTEVTGGGIGGIVAGLLTGIKGRN